MERRRAGKLLFPAIPAGRGLPWLLGGLSGAVLATGLLTSHGEAALLGGVGLAATVVGFPLARLVLGGPEAPQDGDATDGTGSSEPPSP